MRKNKIVCVVPARLGSTRVHRKPMLRIDGRYIFEYALQTCLDAELFDAVVLTSESEEVLSNCMIDRVLKIRTSKDPQSGSERLGELLDFELGDTYVLMPCDMWPFSVRMVRSFVAQCVQRKCQVGTLIGALDKDEDILSEDVMKVVTDFEGYGMSFTRKVYVEKEKPISYYRSVFNKQIGVYYYTDNILRRFLSLKQPEIEIAEKNETLRFLFNGYRVFCPVVEEHIFTLNCYYDISRMSSAISSRIEIPSPADS